MAADIEVLLSLDLNSSKLQQYLLLLHEEIMHSYLVLFI